MATTSTGVFLGRTPTRNILPAPVADRDALQALWGGGGLTLDAAAPSPRPKSRAYRRCLLHASAGLPLTVAAIGSGIAQGRRRLERRWCGVRGEPGYRPGCLGLHRVRCGSQRLRAGSPRWRPFRDCRFHRRRGWPLTVSSRAFRKRHWRLRGGTKAPPPRQRWRPAAPASSAALAAPIAQAAARPGVHGQWVSGPTVAAAWPLAAESSATAVSITVVAAVGNAAGVAVVDGQSPEIAYPPRITLKAARRSYTVGASRRVYTLTAAHRAYPPV